MCKKTYFIDEKNALFYIDKLKRTSCREKIPVSAYLCTKCMNWHLTSIALVDHKSNMQIVYLKREIDNLKAKILELQNENKSLKNL